MDLDELALVHKALSVPARLRILLMIAERPLCVNAITRSMDISQPSVSQHLAVLRHAGLVSVNRRGYKVHYSINRAKLGEFRKASAAFPDAKQRGDGLERETGQRRAARRPA